LEALIRSYHEKTRRIYNAQCICVVIQKNNNLNVIM
jgi:hypothetical protein